MKLILQYSNRSLLPGEFDVIVMGEISFCFDSIYGFEICATGINNLPVAPRPCVMYVQTHTDGLY